MPENSNDGSLDRAILAAHTRGDASALVDLYRQAADFHESQGNVDAACFFLTQALVFALQTASPMEQRLRARLAAYGRETPP